MSGGATSSPIFKQLLSNIAKLFLAIIESDKKVCKLNLNKYVAYSVIFERRFSVKSKDLSLKISSRPSCSERPQLARR